MTFPDYETGEIKLRARMGIGTDERHDMASDTKAIVDAALGDKVLMTFVPMIQSSAEDADIGIYMSKDSGLGEGWLVQAWPTEDNE